MIPFAWVAAGNHLFAGRLGPAAIARAAVGAVGRAAAGGAAGKAVQWLASHSGWLVILDNVTDPADVAPLLARAPAGT